MENIFEVSFDVTFSSSSDEDENHITVISRQISEINRNILKFLSSKVPVKTRNEFIAYVERKKLKDLFADLFWQCFLNNAENPPEFLIKYLLEIASKNHEETVGNLRVQNSELQVQLDELNQHLDIIVETSIAKQDAQPKRRKTMSSNGSVANQAPKRRRTAHAINAIENNESVNDCSAKQLEGNKKARSDEAYLNGPSDVATTSRGMVTRGAVRKSFSQSNDEQLDSVPTKKNVSKKR